MDDNSILLWIEINKKFYKMLLFKIYYDLIISKSGDSKIRSICFSENNFRNT